MSALRRLPTWNVDAAILDALGSLTRLHTVGVAWETGIATAVVSHHLEALEARGLVRRIDMPSVTVRIYRDWELTDAGREAWANGEPIAEAA